MNHGFRILPAAALALLAAGCVSDRITNLTPPELPREPAGLYRVEVEFRNRQRSMRWDSVRAEAVVGETFHPLQLSPLMTNRWEGWVPVPAGEDRIFYRFRWDFTRQGFGGTPSNSVRSGEYRLEIVDR
ncbi:MAG: hypothetical protein ACKVYV_02860 [Limisphaerales bacterium]